MLSSDLGDRGQHISLWNVRCTIRMKCGRCTNAAVPDNLQTAAKRRCVTHGYVSNEKRAGVADKKESPYSDCRMCASMLHIDQG
jgi:hypothetical protein